MKRFFHSLSLRLRLPWNRRAAVAHVVDQLQLTPHTYLHVVDVDGRRLVFATGTHAIGLLALYERRPYDPTGEEAASGPV